MTENERMKPVRTVISMTAAEFSLLAQLVFLGNYVVNGCRSPKEELGEYNALADMIGGGRGERDRGRARQTVRRGAGISGSV